MPCDGALQLKDYPTDMVRLACTRCPRRGQYRRAALMVKFGREISLPTMRVLIAKCEHDGKLGAACGVYYVDLAPKK
jgi:hypothetical protein